MFDPYIYFNHGIITSDFVKIIIILIKMIQIFNQKSLGI